MKDLQLSLYDFLGYVIPGFILIIGLAGIFDVHQPIEKKFCYLMSIGTTGWIILVVLSYILGHLLHSISNLTIDKFRDYPPKRYFDKKDDDILEHQRKMISIKIASLLNKPTPTHHQDEIKLIGSSYWLCYTYILNNLKSPLSPIFLSLTGFYRGITVCFALLTIFTLVKILYLLNALGIAFILIFYRFLDFFGVVHLFIFFIFFIFFLKRTFRFTTYFNNIFYTEFLIAKEDKVKEDKAKENE